MADFIQKQIDICNDDIRKAEAGYDSATDPDERARLFEGLQLLQKQRLVLYRALEKSYEPGVLLRVPPSFC
jgi:hypothetical protein